MSERVPNQPVSWPEMVTYFDAKEQRLREDIREDIKSAVAMMASTIALSQSKDRKDTFRWMLATMLTIIALLIGGLGLVINQLT